MYVCKYISQKYNRVHTEQYKKEACSVVLPVPAGAALVLTAAKQ